MRTRRPPLALAALGAAALAASLVPPAAAQAAPDPAPDNPWTREKCVRYERSWREALRRYGEAGLSPEFLARHEAFVAGGCAGPRNVCPRSARDFELANVLTIRAMNAGAASTFLPFSCR